MTGIALASELALMAGLPRYPDLKSRPVSLVTLKLRRLSSSSRMRTFYKRGPAHHQSAGLILMQTQGFIERIMHDVVEEMPPMAQPSAEELRMEYPPVGCWAPTCET